MGNKRKKGKRQLLRWWKSKTKDKKRKLKSLSPKGSRGNRRERWDRGETVRTNQGTHQDRAGSLAEIGL